jgi:class 3 adenylate cyclase
MVRFAIDALQIIDDMNVKLNSLLAVRIGINTGGPVLAGVLGTDRPTFDIIGDPINIAARLQSTDVPGKIQISETTQELVQGLEFQVEYRGEIELKGKGKKKTYLVDPTQLQPGGISASQSTLESFTTRLL